MTKTTSIIQPKNKDNQINRGPNSSSLCRDTKSLGLQPVSGISWNNLTGSKMKLARGINSRRPIVVNITKKSATVIAFNLCPLSLNAPVI